MFFNLFDPFGLFSSLPSFSLPAYSPPVYELPVYTPPVYTPPVFELPVYTPPVYTPPAVTPPQPATEVLFHDKAETQWLSGTGSKDVFVINGSSSDYQASRTMDNTGIVVWSGDKFDILTGFETLRFSDMDITADASGNFTFPVIAAEPAPAPAPTPVADEVRYYEAAGTQYIDGTTAKDVFIVNGVSADYNVVTALDGIGVVVKRGDQFDVLHGIDTIRFNDRDVQADSRGQFDIHGVLNTEGEMIQYNVAGTQWMEGFSAKDVYVAGGKSSDFGIGKAADGWGVVVWQGDNYDILYDVEVIRFDDKDILSSSIV